MDTHTALGQLPGRAVLDTQVDGGHDRHRLAPGELAAGLDHVALRRGHLSGQGCAGHLGGAAHRLQADLDGCGRGAAGVVSPCRQGVTGEDAGAHGAALTKVAGQRTGVDLAQTDHVLVDQLVLQLAPGAPAGGTARRLAYDVAGHPDARGLRVLVVDARVADVRCGLDHDLAVVGGVGEGLLVPGHPGVEDDLPHRAPGGAVGTAAQDVAVLQHQQGGTAVTAAFTHLFSPPVSRSGRRRVPWGGRAGRSR